MRQWTGHTWAGVHGLGTNAPESQNIRLETVRQIVNGYDIVSGAVTQAGLQAIADALWAAPYRIGIFTSIRWTATNNSRRDNPPSNAQANTVLGVMNGVATSATGIAMRAAGKYIIAGANEFGGGIGEIYPNDQDQWFLWLDGLTTAVRTNLPDAIIATPSITAGPALAFPEEVLDDARAYRQQITARMLKWSATPGVGGKPKCDLIDIHAHSKGLHSFRLKYTQVDEYMASLGLGGNQYYTCTEGGIANLPDRTDRILAIRELRRILECASGRDPEVSAAQQFRLHSFYYGPPFPLVNLPALFQWSHLLNSSPIAPHQPFHGAFKAWAMGQRRLRGAYV